jgi:hypothetical protein
MSRPHDPADMRDLLLEALDETGREYELTDKLVGPISEMAAASIRINGHSFTIIVRQSK